MTCSNSIAVIALNRKLANLRYARDLDREYDDFVSRVQRLCYAGVITEEDAEKYIDCAAEEKERTEIFRSVRDSYNRVYSEVFDENY